MSNNWVLKRDNLIISIYDNNIDGRDQAILLMNNKLSEDITYFEMLYPQDIVEIVTENNMCKGIQVSKISNGNFNDVNYTSTINNIVRSYNVIEFTNES